MFVETKAFGENQSEAHLPNTMRDFYEWVKTRDPNETYNYYDYSDCARARYCRSRGLSYNVYDSFDGHPIEAAAMQEDVYKGHLTMKNLRKEIEEHWL